MNSSNAGLSAAGTVPSMLDLVRLSRRTLFPPGGKELYHQIALLTDLSEGTEVLVAACGQGTTLSYFVEEFGVQGEGVDEDAGLVEAARARAKEKGLGERLHVQRGSMEDLPYRDGVFDVVVGEIGLTTHADPETAIGELARVTKPGGRIVLVQLVWKAPVEPRRQAVLSRHLGARPLMLVELKRILRGAGVERLHTEAWSDEDTAFGTGLTKPFPDFAEMFSLREKVGILRRAWRRWGWRGVQAALAREREVHRLLTKERVLGLDLITGWKSAEAAQPAEAGVPHAETVDLPLFLQGEER
jgi:SAM-dependent methyltransferase